jgi:cell division protein FtsZ
VLLSIAGPTDLTLHEVNQAADAITRVAHPDANIIFGAVIDDVLGEEVRVTVVAAGFDKTAPSTDEDRFQNRLSRLLEEPSRSEAREELPSILTDEDVDDVFTTAEPEPHVTFDAEEDLDIPDFLKS